MNSHTSTDLDFYEYFISSTPYKRLAKRHKMRISILCFIFPILILFCLNTFGSVGLISDYSTAIRIVSALIVAVGAFLWIKMKLGFEIPGEEQLCRTMYEDFLRNKSQQQSGGEKD